MKIFFWARTWKRFCDSSLFLRAFWPSEEATFLIISETSKNVEQLLNIFPNYYNNFNPGLVFLNEYFLNNPLIFSFKLPLNFFYKTLFLSIFYCFAIDLNFYIKWAFSSSKKAKSSLSSISFLINYATIFSVSSGRNVVFCLSIWVCFLILRAAAKEEIFRGFFGLNSAFFL